MENYFYINQDKIFLLDHLQLSMLQERCKIKITPTSALILERLKVALEQLKPKGIIFEMAHGLPTHAQIKTSQKILRRQNCSIWFYWKDEQALEFIDLDLLRHYRFMSKFLIFLKINKVLFFPFFKFLFKTIQKARKHKANQESSAPRPIYKSFSTFNENGYKSEIQNQWDHNPCGSQYVKNADLHTLDWFQEVEAYRYQTYAPWMPQVMEFKHFINNRVLEIGSGIGTDLAQFAKYGAEVTDLDLSYGHLSLAQENFALRQLKGTFCHGDAENLPFHHDYFDLIYSNGVIHHTPDTQKVISEMYRVLKPGGKIIIMVYARNSFFYWKLIVIDWFLRGVYKKESIGEMLSKSVEKSDNDAKPLVKVYTKKSLAKLFHHFQDIQIIKRQLTVKELLFFSKFISANWLSKFIGWNLILKAHKPLN